MRCIAVLVSWFLISFIGFLSGAVIIAHILKHHFGVKGLWLQNDSKDGDFPPQWWLDKYDTGFKYLNAILWWFRNHSWNYICLFRQPGTPDKKYVNVLESNYNLNKGHYLEWANHREGIYGSNYQAYRVKNGRLCMRYSFANKWFTFQIGSGGDRYKMMLVPLWPVLLLIAIVVFAIVKY